MKDLVLDIGTSSCKGAVIEDDGRVLAQSQEAYPLVYPGRGLAELNPLLVFEKVKSCIKKLSPFAADAVGMSISGIGESFVFLDGENCILNNWIMYTDERCQGMERELIQTLGAEGIWNHTGVYPNESLSFFRLQWWKRHHPEIWNKIRKILFTNDLFYFLFTGEGGVDPATASKTLLYDIHKRDWSPQMLWAAGVEREWLSPIRDFGDFIGFVEPRLARELGLPSGIKLYMGAHDQVSAALGGGIQHTGEGLMGEGSTESVNILTDEGIFQKSRLLLEKKMFLEPYVLPGRYLLPVSFLTYGSVVRWLFQWLNQGQEGELEKNAQEPTELIFLPHFSKVHSMDASRGVPGALVGLDFDTKPGEVYRSLLQGLNFETRLNLQMLKDLQIPFTKAILSGGLSRSRLFCQIKADVLEQEIHVLQDFQGGLLGLKIIAMTGGNRAGDCQEAMKRMEPEKQTYTPMKDYSRLFGRYVQVRQRLMGTNERF